MSDESGDGASARQAHWNAVYTTRSSTEVSWFEPVPARSLELLAACGVGPDAAVIDVGGGDSRLVDGLLERGFERLTVLDISAAALARARERLGESASHVAWIAGDVTRAELPRAAYDAWHDRAVFHFLTDASDRRRYVEALRAALRPGGVAVIATFAPTGPARCSGLDVVRYDATTLGRELGADFELIAEAEHVHRTPSGAEQRFVYAAFRRA